MSLASAPSETANSILRRELEIGETPTQPPALIEFRIPAGTGSNPWNTRDTPVKGVVGQTLRILDYISLGGWTANMSVLLITVAFIAAGDAVIMFASWAIGWAVRRALRIPRGRDFRDNQAAVF
jgi:hypothetical protein